MVYTVFTVQLLRKQEEDKVIYHTRDDMYDLSLDTIAVSKDLSLDTLQFSGHCLDDILVVDEKERQWQHVTCGFPHAEKCQNLSFSH